MSFHRCALWIGGWGMVACGSSVADAVSVRPGVEVLVMDSMHLIAQSRVGLLTNQAGIGRDGTSDVEILLAAGVNLTALFSPEHGFRGVLDQPNVDHGVDAATGLPIFSLYGETRFPTPPMLDGIDVLLVDLQDIGARTFTYISTTLLAMRAVAAAGGRIIVLDRPNPIGGTHVQGPVLDSTLASFVGMLPVPMRHGMTHGELALLGNSVLGIHADLTIVPAAGWTRETWFDGTGLPWVRPSPNMPDIESATHYPGTVIFEATNLSVGRGTAIAFQVIGAPWLDAPAVIARLPGTPGVRVSETVIVPREPTDGKYADNELPAVRLSVTDRRVYDPVQTAVALLVALYAVHGDSLTINAPSLDQRLGVSDWREGIRATPGTGRRWPDWRLDLETFGTLRRRFLLYEIRR